MILAGTVHPHRPERVRPTGPGRSKKHHRRSHSHGRQGTGLRQGGTHVPAPGSRETRRRGQVDPRPRGRNAVLDKSWGGPTVTKDGVTVAEEIELGLVENMGPGSSARRPPRPATRRVTARRPPRSWPRPCSAPVSSTSVPAWMPTHSCGECAKQSPRSLTASHPRPSGRGQDQGRGDHLRQQRPRDRGHHGRGVREGRQGRRHHRRGGQDSRRTSRWSKACSSTAATSARTS